MKYCTKCGNEIMEEAVICPKCGCATKNAGKSSVDMKTLALIFMIVTTVCYGLYLIPLAWCLPMTLYYHNQIKNKQPVSMSFKVCTIIFVSPISGILMLCDKD